MPEEPGRRVRPRREHVREGPPVIPVDDKLPMDWYNMEMRRYQNDLGLSMNYHNKSFFYLFEQMNIFPRPGPRYPYVASWEERVNQRRNQAGGSGAGGNEEEDEY